MMSIDGVCGCEDASGSCPGCMSSPCMCGDMSEAVEPCAECGMMEVEESCGCTHMDEAEVEEVAPPGKEKMVKALKKDPNIDNPWAVAWAAHGKEKK